MEPTAVGPGLPGLEPFACSGAHTVEVLDRACARLETTAGALGRAAPLIGLAEPDGWRSPAAALYSERLEDLAARCRSGQNHVEEAWSLVRGYRAWVVGKLGLP
ncbi:MAG: hypothetical protein LBS27_05535 [Bifidobacteriaceae bacterium]|nr:hypothetical protein [Bifidobacteriaceae bacterium]